MGLKNFTWCAVSLTLIVLMSETWALPTGYILKVTPTCGSDGVEDGYISIVTDLKIDARALCDGNTVTFDSTDHVHFKLPVSYPGGSLPCIFHKKVDAEVYSVRVIVSYGETGSFIQKEEEEVTITCTFSPRASNISETHGVLERLIAPPEDKNNMGSSSTATITMMMTNVVGDDLPSPVDLGRIVKLRATASNNATSENGLRPTSCDAIAPGMKYAILRAGCGDGVVFKKTDGFITDGLVTTSPYFEAFSLNGQTTLNFECNFTLCTQNCDGSSCSTAPTKHRRDLHDIREGYNRQTVLGTSVTLSAINLRPSRQIGHKNILTANWAPRRSSDGP